MCMSPNKRFLAVGERGTTVGIITIYDMFTQRKKKVLHFQECSSKVGNLF
jgi:hypothetical protein